MAKVSPASNKTIKSLHKIIGKMGKIAERDFDNLVACIKEEIWEESEVMDWAQNFVEDPWRDQHKQYRSVAHFLRDPEQWVDSKKVEEEQSWTPRK